jgi:hypothetical protein
MRKELLKKLGEETIYSAKGHFKAVDIRRNLVIVTISTCAILNIVGLFDLNSLVGRILSAFGLLGTIALLIWNEGEGKNYRANHKRVGEEYLALHKQIRECYFLDACSDEVIKSLSEKVQGLDKSEKPDIPGIARKMAKKAIEGNDAETDNWFIK